MKQRTVFIILGFVSMAGLQATSAMAKGTSCRVGAQDYWKTFRAAALQENPSALAKLSRFPFYLKGALDESDTRQIPREKFADIVPVLLGTDPGLSPAPATMKDLVQATTRLSPSFCNTQGNQFRVGSWVFELTAEGWRFVRAFIDE